MEGITHKIRFKTGDSEIEVVGSRDFTEKWFQKLQIQVDLVSVPEPKKSSIIQKDETAKTHTERKQMPLSLSILDSIVFVAYKLQTVKGKSSLVVGDIQAEMENADMKLPGNFLC